jgi:uncharacterized protein
MIVDLFTIKNSPYDFEVSIPVEEIDLESEDVRLKTDVRAECRLTKRIMQADVEGKIFAALETECTRCLQQIERNLEIPFKVSFVTEENYPEARETELKDEDLNVSIFNGAIIDITELVREQILLNLPEQEFCSENCLGLCEKCGANLNTNDCRCEEEEIDPRWSALKNLK